VLDADRVSFHNSAGDVVNDADFLSRETDNQHWTLFHHLACHQLHHNQQSTLIIIIALHAMHMHSSNENSVCLSVRLSVKRVDSDKTKEKSARFLYHMKDHLT